MSSSYDYEAPSREHSRRYREERPRYEDPYYRVSSSRNELVPRAREDSELSIEEVHRDFPPPGYSSRESRRTRSAEPGYDDYYYGRERSHRSSRRPGSVYYEEEERARRKRVLGKQEKIVAALVGGVIAAGAKEAWDRREAKQEGIEDVQRNVAASAALGAAGALAGYQGATFYNKHSDKADRKSSYMVHKGRDGRVTEYYEDDEDGRGHKGNKNFLESALSAAGLGSAIKALTGGSDDHRRGRHGSSDSRGSRSKSQDTPANRIQKAAKASLVAGAAEAFRVAKEPGDWKGEKIKRVMTAAAGAGALDAIHDPTKDTKRHLLESVIGGLVGNRALNGSRKDIEEDRYTGRSRSRSRARSSSRGGSGAGGLAALATAGLGALGAKKAISRSRSRSRRGSFDSYDSRDGSPKRRHRSRSRSIVDGARRSLAKIGLGDDPDKEDYYDDRSSRGGRRRGPDSRYDDDDYSSSRGYMRGGRGDDYYDDDRSIASRRRDRSRRRGDRSSSVSSSELGDSDNDERKYRKMRGKQLLTSGMAAVATIHAAHTVHGSLKSREARQKAVASGRLTQEESRKIKSKAIMQDLASVGLAGVALHSAASELKEAHDKTKETKEWAHEKQRRHDRRVERLNHENEGVQYSGRTRADGWSTWRPRREDRYAEGPSYADGNPYASLPAPPVGRDDRH